MKHSVKSVPGDVAKAWQIIATARNKARLIGGDSNAAHNKRELYETIADTLESAVALSQGALPERSAHWRKKLPTLIDQALDQMKLAKEMTALKSKDEK